MRIKGVFKNTWHEQIISYGRALNSSETTSQYVILQVIIIAYLYNIPKICLSRDQLYMRLRMAFSARLNSVDNE